MRYLETAHIARVFSVGISIADGLALPAMHKTHPEAGGFTRTFKGLGVNARTKRVFALLNRAPQRVTVARLHGVRIMRGTSVC
jgi:hypothetical protein